MRILIADDHAVIREGLKQILLEEYPKAEIGEARNATEALELAWKQKWDLVLVDITMPGRSGLDVLKELKRDQPGLPVLVLSVHSEDQYALRALKAGAAGFLNKDAAVEQLVGAVKKVLAGGKYVSGPLAEKLASAVESPVGQLLHETLSDRELHVFRLLAAGKTVTQIAVELSLSVKTVSTYRSRLLEKMRLTTNAELMRYALEHGLGP